MARLARNSPWSSLALTGEAGESTGLVDELFDQTKGSRIDLLSTEGSDAFYRTFEHKEFLGFRIYPADQE
jgi:hypothetical protein